MGRGSIVKLLEWQEEMFVLHSEDSEVFESFTAGGGQGNWGCISG